MIFHSLFKINYKIINWVYQSILLRLILNYLIKIPLSIPNNYDLSLIKFVSLYIFVYQNIYSFFYFNNNLLLKYRLASEEKLITCQSIFMREYNFMPALFVSPYQREHVLAVYLFQVPYASCQCELSFYLPSQQDQ